MHALSSSYFMQRRMIFSFRSPLRQINKKTVNHQKYVITLPRNRALRNWECMLRLPNLRPRCRWQEWETTTGEVSFMSMHHLWTFLVGQRYDIDNNLPLFEPVSVTQNKSDQQGKPEVLWQYHIYRGSKYTTNLVNGSYRDGCEWLWHAEWR